MQSALRVAAASLIVVAASFVIRADVTPSSQASEIQLQLGDLLFAEGQYLDSLEAYRNALKAAPPEDARRPRDGRHCLGAARGRIRPRPGRGGEAVQGGSAPDRRR